MTSTRHNSKMGKESEVNSQERKARLQSDIAIMAGM